MLYKKKEHPKVKSGLHPRNKHRERYDFKQLIDSCPELSQFVELNDYKDETIDFFNPEAVKMLNKALLKHYYDIDNWDIPKNHLCPPIPGRADYIHHIADLLCCNNPEFPGRKIPRGNKIKCLDIGVGANCVYPIIGNKEYGWSFIGTDIDPVSIESANKIIEMNPILKGKIEIRLQCNPQDIFYGIIQKSELFDLSVCNPPFHASLAEAQSGTVRKLRNLKHKKITKPILNFGGQNNELWCEGGEERFVGDMIYQSKQFSTSCFWFSTLISNQSNLKNAYKALKKVKTVEVKTIPMGQGNKTSRIVAWTFLTPEQQKKWINTRWNEM
jgi:23S rRNA (adenine1618-N6)-methyltransferase